ncbi:MAG: hypothetical protein RQ743_00860 [Bacteroidales bacterium]|nr:hypothetical protein [Bacteroidales bacterium]
MEQLLTKINKEAPDAKPGAAMKRMEKLLLDSKSTIQGKFPSLTMVNVLKNMSKNNSTILY